MRLYCLLLGFYLCWFSWLLDFQLCVPCDCLWLHWLLFIDWFRYCLAFPGCFWFGLLTGCWFCLFAISFGFFCTLFVFRIAAVWVNYRRWVIALNGYFLVVLLYLLMCSITSLFVCACVLFMPYLLLFKLFVFILGLLLSWLFTVANCGFC